MGVGRILIPAMAVAALMAAPAGAAAGWTKLTSSSDAAQQASASVFTLYPILAQGEKPYTRFRVRLVARPAQKITLASTIQCSSSDSDDSRSFGPQKVLATPAGRSYVLLRPFPAADYCSARVSAEGRRFVKVTLYGAR